MIQRKTVTAELFEYVKTDSLLKPSEALTKVCDFRACVYPLNGNISQYQFINAVGSTHIGITKHKGIAEGMAIKIGSAEYKVTFVVEESRNVQLYLQRIKTV